MAYCDKGALLNHEGKEAILLTKEKVPTMLRGKTTKKRNPGGA